MMTAAEETLNVPTYLLQNDEDNTLPEAAVGQPEDLDEDEDLEDDELEDEDLEDEDDELEDEEDADDLEDEDEEEDDEDEDVEPAVPPTSTRL